MKTRRQCFLAALGILLASPGARAAIKDHFARTAADNLWLDQAREARQ